MLHIKFQVSSRPGTCFSKVQIWPKSAVKRVLNVYRPGKCFFSLLGFEFGVMWGCFSGVLGLPYRLTSLLIFRENMEIDFPRFATYKSGGKNATLLFLLSTLPPLSFLLPQPIIIIGIGNLL